MLTLRGVLRSEEKWVTANWDRMIRAHREELPEFESLAPGTFNVFLVDPVVWNPPDDEFHRRQSYEKGLRFGDAIEAGADFLKCGNYVHPQIHVTSINGLPIAGRAYYGGSAEYPIPVEGLPAPMDRSKIEIMSKEHLRSRLKMTDLGSEHPCEVVLTITPKK